MALQEINDAHTFSTNKDFFSIKLYKECMEKFRENFDLESSFATQTPLFLDTNVLLRYYTISFTARKKLFDFIKSNKKRIFITAQVQFEFLKNREETIKIFFEQVTNKIPRDFRSDIVNQLMSFLEKHKVILKDYQMVENNIQKHKVDLEKLLEQLTITVEKKRNEYKDLLLDDEFLDLLLTCNLLESLSPEEVGCIKKDFDSLAKEISNDNIDSLRNKPNKVFPGLGDIKEKREDPYGDYIIYHEMIKHMLNHSKGAVFLTFDTTKGDWQSKNKQPFLHYILNAYSTTRQILYIVDAERSLEKQLNVEINSLVSEQSENTRPLTSNYINDFFSEHKLFSSKKRIEIPDKLIYELQMAGYKTINDIAKDVNIAYNGIIEYIIDGGAFLSNIGILKVALRIANPDYTRFFSSSGIVRDINPDQLKKYSYYRDKIYRH